MSIYKHKRSPYWQYDFQIDGIRFRGSTKTAEKRYAKTIEAQARTDAINERRLGRRRPMTLNDAFGRYWDECAERHANAETEDYQLSNLLKHFGKDRLLSEITNPDITEYMARRRATVRDSSVNREIELLRRVHRRADGLWNADIGAMPNWKQLLLSEPEGRVRCLSDDEEMSLFAALRKDFHPFVSFCLKTGVRLSNAIQLTWSDVDFDGGLITVRLKSRKPGGKAHSIPLTQALIELIADEHGQHPIYVFTYECKKSRRGRRKGERYPFTKNGWRKDWARALKAAGIGNFRFHDLRHTAATRTLRASGNIKAVQEMLGHSDLTMTARYAHVQIGDVRAAMDAAERRTIPGLALEQTANLLKRKG